MIKSSTSSSFVVSSPTVSLSSSMESLVLDSSCCFSWTVVVKALKVFSALEKYWTPINWLVLELKKIEIMLIEKNSNSSVCRYSYNSPREDNWA